MQSNGKNNSATTVLTIVVGFMIIYWVTKFEWALYTSILVGVLSIMSSWIRDQIELVWNLLAKGLSYIVPNILLSLVFYFFLTPIAFLSRLFGKKDPLMIKKSPSSTWISEEKTFSKESFEKTW